MTPEPEDLAREIRQLLDRAAILEREGYFDAADTLYLEVNRLLDSAREEKP